MANKQALRELQTRLAERLASARAQPAGRSWLAVECGGRGMLFPLRDAGEIFALAPLAPVPHTRPWFLGVANLRGHLHGVVDLAGFLGVAAAPAQREQTREQARLVGFNPTVDINCALLVDRLAGLRAESQLEPLADDGAARPPFVGARLRDRDGREWQELRLAELAADENFLHIVS
jgi:twitching motility protein PilI